MAIISQSPATGEVFEKFDELTDLQIEEKLSLAQVAYAEWKNLDFSERATLMKKVAIKLRERKTELAILMAQEMGKVLKFGEGEVEKCAAACDFYADNAATFLAPENIATAAKESFVRFDPIGPVLAVMPWNFPFFQVFRFAAPALMAGNVGLLKHASNVPRCALKVEEIFVECGFPIGVFQTLLIGASKVEKIILDKRVAAVTLTGSEAAGSQVAAAAGKALKKCVLELGGSDAFIVLKDADLDLAAKTAVTTRLQGNVGQSCVAAKRFIVVKEVAEKFISLLNNEVSGLKVGDPSDPTVDVGPLYAPAGQETIQSQLEKTLALGGKLESTASSTMTSKSFFSPCVVSGVKKGMPLYDEEVFGPIIAVIIVEDEKEALMVANDSEYGLGGSIFTADTELAKKLAAQMETGTIYINGQMRSDVRLPFGGIKKSGFGRELGTYGIKEFVNIKTVVVEK